MLIEFSDGVKFDTSGEYRIEWRQDGPVDLGLYVVGRGMLCAVDSIREGEELIQSLTK